MTFIIDVASVIKFIFKYLLLKLYKPLQFCSLPKNNTEGLEGLRRIIDCVPVDMCEDPIYREQKWTYNKALSYIRLEYWMTL